MKFASAIAAGLMLFSTLPLQAQNDLPFNLLDDSPGTQLFNETVDPFNEPDASDLIIQASCDSEGCTDSILNVNCDQCVPTGNCGTWVNFTPYVWATQTRGTITVEGNTVPLNLDLSDLWEILENGEVRGGFMGHLEFGRDDWSIMINGDIVSMAPTEEFRLLDVNAGLTLDVFEIGATKTLFSQAPEQGLLGSPFSVQVLGGVRYYSMSVEATFTGPGPLPPTVIDQADNWVDLFAGARVVTQLTPGIKGVLRGDWAGFGIGTSSEKTWNLMAVLIMDCGCDCADLMIGYRILDIEQSKNGGTGAPRGFGVDNQIHGPVAGLSFQF